ncbi:MAG: DUF4382 domain-containing protein [Gloeocapsa sp. DLM2.Bin57]|nr:MAG: DUF4382 domain-containing protein [Gloeocapsa sp. DLM2.Bin57]
MLLKIKTLLGVGILASLLSLTTATASESLVKQATEDGKLSLVAEGEDFVREGFTTKDNWQIEFDHVYVTLAEIKAFQTEPPFDPATDNPLEPVVTVVLLERSKTVDLATTDEVVVVAQIQAPPGHYNALSWKVTPSEEGATILLQGTATRDGETINFNIAIAQPLEYTCGEYIGDERKGIVITGGEAELETTFHFDHIFGDADKPADDPLNTDALGFDPLAALAQNGELVIDSATLQAQLSPQDYETLTKAIASLGHVGEGHCR